MTPSDLAYAAAHSLRTFAEAGQPIPADVARDIAASLTDLHGSVLGLEASHRSLGLLMGVRADLPELPTPPVRVDRMRAPDGSVQTIRPGRVISGCFTVVAARSEVTTKHLSGCFRVEGAAP